MQTDYFVIIHKIFDLSLFSCGSPGANKISLKGGECHKQRLCQQKNELTLDDRC